MKPLFFTIAFISLFFSGWTNDCVDISKSDSSTKRAGVYLTAYDFANCKKAFIDSNFSEKQKIRKHYIFNSDYIDVVQGKIKARFHKDSIYAYEDNDGNVYRLYGKHHDEYQIIEVGKIVIYMTEERDFASKNYKPIYNYFFSIGYTSNILPLTLKNIKFAFPDNFKLHHYLDMELNSKEILSYDETNKMYRINYLLTKYTQD